MWVCRWVEQYGQQIYSETCSSAILQHLHGVGRSLIRDSEMICCDKPPQTRQHNNINRLFVSYLNFCFLRHSKRTVAHVCSGINRLVCWLVVSNFVSIIKTTQLILLKNLIAVYYLNYMRLIGKIQFSNVRNILVQSAATKL